MQPRKFNRYILWAILLLPIGILPGVLVPNGKLPGGLIVTMAIPFFVGLLSLGLAIYGMADT